MGFNLETMSDYELLKFARRAIDDKYYNLSERIERHAKHGVVSRNEIEERDRLNKQAEEVTKLMIKLEQEVE